MVTQSKYSETLDNLTINKANQDRLAPLIEALATAIPCLTNFYDKTTTDAVQHLNKKTLQLINLFQEEEALTAKLEEQRKKGEF